MTDPISPQGVEFRRVSSSLTKVRLIGAGIGLLLPALICVLVTIPLVSMGLEGVAPWLYGVAGFLLLLFLWLLWLIPRQVKAIGYATTDTDFLVRRGIMFRRLDIVPYGRIQFVDVNEGPIARRLGIATCQLHTASAGTDAKIDGLPVGEAAVLRDLLVANGSSNLSGL